jgi:hypothetical protein
MQIAFALELQRAAHEWTITPGHTRRRPRDTALTKQEESSPTPAAGLTRRPAL